MCPGLNVGGPYFGNTEHSFHNNSSFYVPKVSRVISCMMFLRSGVILSNDGALVKQVSGYRGGQA